MESASMLSQLIDTYKYLNMNYRNVGDNPGVTTIVRRMRDDEIAFSQALKDHLTGIGTADNGDRTQDADDLPLPQLISQFGTARATTLNLLKGIADDSVWERTSGDGRSIRAHVQDLVQSDANQLKRLAALVSGDK